MEPRSLPQPSGGVPTPPPPTPLPLFPAEVVSAAEHQEEAQDGEVDDGVPRHHQATGPPLDHRSAGKDDRQPERGHHDARGEEVRQLPTGVAGRVRVIAQPFGNEVGDGGHDVEHQDKKRPVNPILFQCTAK